MNSRSVSVILGLAVLLAAGGSASHADTAGRWLHVRVLDRSQSREAVRINLPLAMLETLATSIEAGHVKEGRVQLGDSGLGPDQLREMWKALRSAGDMEYVTVESADETVRVARSGNYMLTKIRGTREGQGGREKVDVKVPLAVVDALLDAPEGQLNFKGALQRLAQHQDGDLVTIEDGTSNVRIWIDDRSTADD
jgi:hypothetical protein